ncbi:MAG: hypothetical protein RTU63_04735 [Candidatus Thorarchaeota archaeon]
MRNKRYFVSGAGLLIVFGVLILIGSVILAYMNNFTPLPWDPSQVVLGGMVGFIVFIALASGLIMMDTSWATRLHRNQQPREMDRDLVVRVVTSDVAKKEYFVYGKPDEIVREVVENDWPFKGKLKSKEWFVIDEADNDVSGKIYSEVDGILRVVFD